jgi:hypothetical protein
MIHLVAIFRHRQQPSASLRSSPAVSKVTMNHITKHEPDLRHSKGQKLLVLLPSLHPP